MQEITNDYNELLQILKSRWKGNSAFFSKHIGITESKASRILSGKQQPSFEVLEKMARIAGINVSLTFSE